MAAGSVARLLEMMVVAEVVAVVVVAVEVMVCACMCACARMGMGQLCMFLQVLQSTDTASVPES